MELAVFVCTILQIWPKNEIRLHLGRSQIWVGFVKMAGFRPEPKYGTPPSDFCTSQQFCVKF